MTLIREEQPPPGSFDWMLDPANLDIDPPDRPRLLRRKVTTGARGFPPPPTPPDREGGNNPRVRIEIEIVDRSRQAAPQPRGYRFGTLTLWILAIAALAALVGCTAYDGRPTLGQRIAQQEAANTNAIAAGEARYKARQKLEEQQRAQRWADPAYRARWQAMIDAGTGQLLAQYRAHPETDPMNTTFSCNHDTGRLECANWSRTIIIEGRP